MTRKEMYRALRIEPYNIPFAEIATLTQEQLIDILSDPDKKPADKQHRRPIPKPGDPPFDPKADFLALTTTHGFTREQAEQAFAKAFPHYQPRA